MTQITISASLVKELRQRTGGGMMMCKKVLIEAEGDIEKAIIAMRSAGQAKAVKKAGRSTAEGLIVVVKNDKAAVLLEVNCETDFVAREANLIDFANNVAKLALEKSITDVKDLNPLVEEQRLALVSKVGENISLCRVYYCAVDAGCIATYSHGQDNLTRIGVIVQLASGTAETGRDLAMHIAAMNPDFLQAADVPQDRVEQEKQIFLSQAEEQHKGKPVELLEKIIGGKLNKFLKGITLLGQPFVKDQNLTVEKWLEQQKAKVVSFKRFEVNA